MPKKPMDPSKQHDVRQTHIKANRANKRQNKLEKLRLLNLATEEDESASEATAPELANFNSDQFIQNLSNDVQEAVQEAVNHVSSGEVYTGDDEDDDAVSFNMGDSFDNESSHEDKEVYVDYDDVVLVFGDEK